MKSLTHSRFGEGARNWAPHAVQRAGCCRVLDRRLHGLASHRAPQPHHPHQPLHGAPGHRDALAAQLPPDLPSAGRARSSPHAHRVISDREPRRRGAGGQSACSGHAARRRARDTSTGRSAAAGRPVPRLDRGCRLDPVDAAVIVDEGDHRFSGRSSSAWAKYADAFLRISSAWRSSRFSRSKGPDALTLFRRGPRTRAVIPLGLPQSACTAAASRGDSPPSAPPQPHRRGARRVTALVIAHHPHRPLAQLDRVRRPRLLASHGPHPPKLGASGKPGAVQTFPSVLIGVPGSSGSQATIMDGYPLARQGQAARALGAAFFVSMVGGLIGAVVLFATLSVARPLVLALGSPELFMMAVFRGSAWSACCRAARRCWACSRGWRASSWAASAARPACPSNATPSTGPTSSTASRSRCWRSASSRCPRCSAC